jgi:hypothetical protein
MSNEDPQMCLNCGERQAMSCIGTVPLCSVCSPKTNKRGVKMTVKKSKAKTAATS